MGFLDKALDFVANPFVGASIGVAGDYLGGKKAAEQSLEQRKLDERIHLENMAMQREFAKMGIQWRVEDAKAAGIHPLYAMGGQGATYQPQSSYSIGEDPMANFYSRTGQNIQRAIAATSTAHERQVQALQVERMGLENQVLRNQLTGTPSFPSQDLGLGGLNSQGDAAHIQSVPVRRTASIPGAPYADAGHIADFSFIRTPHGLAIAPSLDVKERIEDQIVPETMWALRNLLTPNLPGKQFPHPTVKLYPLPDNFVKMGYKSWQWSHIQQQFVPSRAPENAGFFRRQKGRFLNK